MICFENVSIGWDETRLFTDLNFEIKKGERCVLMGPSGHGKSVLLKVMAGLLPPSAGRIFVDGQDLSGVASRSYKQGHFRRQIGMLFQNNALFDSMTVYENVAFPLNACGEFNDMEVDRRAHYFLEAVGLSHVHPLYPDELSGGMQKRLGIARAIALEPKLVFYDDPTAGLDPITSRKITHLILEQQKRQGSTIVVVTQDLNRTCQVADRIGLVIDGGVIFLAGSKSIATHPDLRVQKFFLGAQGERCS